MADTHSTSACLLQLPDGRLVFQRRTKDAPVSASKLGLFGGHIETREKALHALRREMSEETSLEMKHIHVRHVGSYISTGPIKGRINLYMAQITSPKFNVYEGAGNEVYSLNEALARPDLEPNTKHVLMEYQALQGREDG